ncbi:MAG: DUF1837 domain-containing protein, partial [Acetivibrio ethanolgignens]
MPRVFDRNNVILLRINESDLNSFLIDTDIGDDGNRKYMLKEFAKVVMEVIPEYVFAHYENEEINDLNAVSKLREAAHSIYKIKEFELMRRYYLYGDFGELILHFLLRDFKGTIPLISKVYFKDSSGVPAHGFDTVHISPNEKVLWLGESKFYSNGKVGIKKLLEDLEEHFKKEYLDEQFIIIKKNLECNEIPQRQQWIEELSNCNKLGDKLNMINIPMLCTYENDIYTKFEDLNEADAINYHELNVRELKKYFDDENKHPLKSRLNVILLLFPVKNKKE